MYCVFTDLFRVIVELGVCETDAGAVQRDPGAPLHPHHQRTHREDHALIKEGRLTLARKNNGYSFQIEFLSRIQHNLYGKFECA